MLCLLGCYRFRNINNYTHMLVALAKAVKALYTLVSLECEHLAGLCACRDIKRGIAFKRRNINRRAKSCLNN